MTFDPNIPLATDLISNSQGDILTNFTQLNTQFGIDHVAFYTGSGNGDGTHKQITFNTPRLDPVLAGDDSMVYSKTVSGVTQLFFANATTAAQVSSTGTAANPGTITIPGGLTIAFGNASITAGVLHNFGYTFSATPYSVVISGPAASSQAPTLFSVNTSQFAWAYSNGLAATKTIQWIAIGPT